MGNKTKVITLRFREFLLFYSLQPVSQAWILIIWSPPFSSKKKKQKQKKNGQPATRKVLRARVKYWYITYKILIFLDDLQKFWDFKSEDYQLLLRIKQKSRLHVTFKGKSESLEIVWCMHVYAYEVIIIFLLQCSTGQAEGTQDWKCE